MLDKQTALDIVKQAAPKAEITGPAEYKDLYLFIIVTPDPYEGDMDPFYAMNKETGAFSEFSIFAHGDPLEVQAAFAAITQEGGA